jgi:glycosyltransferase involved in cell wall biosynthesis
MQDKPSKKILLVTHFLPPSHTAGTEQYTLGLGKSLQAKEYEVTIICAEDWDKGENYWNGVTQEVYDGLTVYRIHLNWKKANNSNRMLYDSLPVEKWLDKFLANSRFDIVHVTSTYSLGVGILRSVKKAKIPLILTLTDFWFLCPSLQLLRNDLNLCNGNTTAWQCQSCLMNRSNFFQRMHKISLPDSVHARIWGTLSHITQVTDKRGFRGLLLNMDERKKIMHDVFTLPDIVISPSIIVRDIFAKNTPRPVILLNHGHDLSWLDRYKGKSNSDKIRIGYLGQILEIKGVHILVEAFIKSDIGAKARLDIWGDHSANLAYTKELISLIGNHETIFLQGKYNKKNLASILANIDVVVVPSIWYENAPLVIQEAFATKTPVITTNLGGMAEAVSHEVNGLLFERNNSEDLARQLLRIVDEQGLLKKLSDAIPQIKSFDDEILELDKIYDQLTG